jgi:hypothetical protein
MSVKMKALTILGGAAVGASVLVGAPIADANPGTNPGPAGCSPYPNCANRGQEVKSANQNDMKTQTAAGSDTTAAGSDTEEPGCASHPKAKPSTAAPA